MNDVILCGHTGSHNRGCEAIIKSTADLLKKLNIEVLLATFNKRIDCSYGINEFKEVIAYRKGNKKNPNFMCRGLIDKLFHIYMPKQTYIQKQVWGKLRGNIAVNVGGDTYCYGTPYICYGLNRYCYKNSIPNILWGCSIEKNKINQEMLDDLKRYTMIFPREIITYQSLIDVGIKQEKIYLMSDPAFTLEPQYVELKHPIENAVGINVSPIIKRSSKIPYNNFCRLIEYILRETDYNVVLIPHVYSEEYPQDLIPLKKLYEQYGENNRIINIVDQYNCRELKHIISKCRFFIGARTHSTIAAYSSYVPTIVVGYSVKSKGIATDLFNIYENYVLSIQTLTQEDELIKAFKFLQKNEFDIRRQLQKIMPQYQERAYNAAKKISELTMSFHKNQVDKE